jgi:hypothetical protein
MSSDGTTTNESVMSDDPLELTIPPLFRQTTAGPDDFGSFFNNGTIVNGQFIAPQFQFHFINEEEEEGDFRIIERGLEETMRNNRLFPFDMSDFEDSGDEYEREELEDSDSDSDSDEDVPMLFSTCICNVCNRN